MCKPGAGTSEPERPGDLDDGLRDASLQFSVDDVDALVEHEEYLAAVLDDPVQSAVEADRIADVVVLNDRVPRNVRSEENGDLSTEDVGASALAADGPPPSLESRCIPSFGVPYMPKCLEWAFGIPIRRETCSYRTRPVFGS